MPRRRDPDRFDRLVAVATDVFIARGGLVRTQIEDIASELGVAKGTVYLYVASKDALYDVCLRRADGFEPAGEPAVLPVPAPSPTQTYAMVQERMTERGTFPALDEALARRRAGNTRAELEAVAGEIYDVLASNRTAIKLLAATARDVPALAELWFGVARRGLNQRLVELFERRRKHLAPLPSPLAAARFTTETCSWFAVHRHWDPQPDPMSDADARTMALSAVYRTLLPPTAEKE